jgi:5-methylcytosine-specific restriction endonuclease McrA
MYYQKPRRNARRNTEESTPVLKDISTLTLDDLKKIRKAFLTYREKNVEYITQKAKHDEKAERTTGHNNRILTEYEKIHTDWHNKNISPIEDLISNLRHRLSLHKIGFIKGLWLDTIEFEGQQYQKLRGEPLVAQINKAIALIEARYRDEPRPPSTINIDKKITPKEPKNYTFLKISGTKLLVYLDGNLEEVERLIEKHESRLTIQATKIGELKARAASTEKEKRAQAQRYRRDIHKQLSKVPFCPYCGERFSEMDAHLDHIYPVAKGGQSAPKNLIFVCSSCNIAKKHDTLRTFLKKRNIEERLVYERLELLNKEF